MDTVASNTAEGTDPSVRLGPGEPTGAGVPAPDVSSEADPRPGATPERPVCVSEASRAEGEGTETGCVVGCPRPQRFASSVGDREELSNAGLWDSFLDSQGITRQVPESLDFSDFGPGGQLAMPWGSAQLGLDGIAYGIQESEKSETGSEEPSTASPRQLWLDEVEAASESWLLRVAGHHRNAAARAKGDPDVPMSTYHWHQDRAEGARRRFEKVTSCGVRRIARECGDCGDVLPMVPMGCSSWAFCLECRSRRAERYRHRFREGRRAAREAYRMALGHGGWSEKFLTLTVPHSGDTPRDVKVVAETRGRFFRLLREHLIKDRGLRPEMARHPYCAVEECTEGMDMRGHPHLHVWMLSPFVSHVVLRVLWWRALPESYQARCPTRPIKEVIRELKGSMSPVRWRRTRAQIGPALRSRRGKHGRLLRDVPWPVLDIRRARGDVGRELVKYLIKDAVRDGETGELVYMEPQLYASICEGFAGLRAVTTSRGFWVADGYSEHCSDCGSLYILHAIIEDADPGEIARPVLPRGPPAGAMCRPYTGV